MKKNAATSPWETLYREQEVTLMPWYLPTLDKDFAEAIAKLNIHSGNALDLGTGPGTQAIALAKLGLMVTATDISHTAVAKAANLARDEGVHVNFRQDDILDSKLDQEFDYIFDRGCFHVMPPDSRSTYIETVSGLLKPGGYLFLKCFSFRQEVSEGPYRFRPEELEQYFSGKFEIVLINESFFEGANGGRRFALFIILRRR